MLLHKSNDCYFFSIRYKEYCGENDMAGRYPSERVGDQVKIHDVDVHFTFWPKAYLERGRLVTSNPWTCLMAHLHQMP